MLVEKLREEVVSRRLVGIYHFVGLFLVAGVKNGEKQVHQEPQSKHQKEDEIKAHKPTLAIRGQHNIRKISRSQQHKHVPEWVARSTEIHWALNSPRENPVPDIWVVKYEADNDNNHLESVSHYVEVSFPVVTQHGDHDY